MATVKENIISGLEHIQDEEFLQAVLALISDKNAEESTIRISPLQKKAFARARQDYENGRFYTTDELFSELENE